MCLQAHTLVIDYITLIQCFHSLGICISYDGLLDIMKYLSERLLYQYERDGVFLPSVLKGIFSQLLKTISILMQNLQHH